MSVGKLSLRELLKEELDESCIGLPVVQSKSEEKILSNPKLSHLRAVRSSKSFNKRGYERHKSKRPKRAKYVQLPDKSFKPKHGKIRVTDKSDAWYKKNLHAKTIKTINKYKLLRVQRGWI